MAKITYDDKVTLNPQPSVANINKTTASDMNEIKQVVNENDDTVQEIINGEVYSTNEVKTNKKWIDGKPIYRIVLEFNNPTTGGKYETFDFSNKTPVRLEGYYIASDGQLESNFYNRSNDTFRCIAFPNSNNVYYKVGTDISVSKVYLILEYTKTTD